MATGVKLFPYKGVNRNLHESLMPQDQARYIKNLVYDTMDSAGATDTKGGQAGVAKNSEANEIYTVITYPAGINTPIGTPSFSETKEVFVINYNSLGRHGVYRINGLTQTWDKVYEGPELNFHLNPENFLHQAGCHLEIIYITDPVTGEKKRRSFLKFAEASNPQRSIAVEDAIATKGFDPVFFPFFGGTYDRNYLISMGVPTPHDCITVKEVPNTETSKSNTLLFTPLQFRISYVDVWGRPSEHGIISDRYIPGFGADCLSSSSNLPRCVDLTFKAPHPSIDKIQVEYLTCGSTVWKISDTLDLYDGSAMGDWWLRKRNSKVVYDATAGTITYRFCRDKQCQSIPVDETNRLFNPLPRTSEGAMKLGNVLSLYNNKDGFLPFTQELKDKIHLTVEKPAPTLKNAFRNISVLVEIYNPIYDKNQPIFFQGIDSGGQKAYGFGGFDIVILATPLQYRSFFAYKQYFKNQAQKNFVMYFAGTNIYTIGKQYMLKPDGSYTEVTDFQNLEHLDSGARYFQQFDFTNVPKGTYVARLASHQSDPTADQNYQQTSTYLAGSYRFDYSNKANPVNHTVVIDHAKELVIDVCEKDYDTKKDNKILVVYDLNAYDSATEQGYVYNTDDPDERKYGVELLSVDFIASANNINSKYTDHNGFYFIQSTRNRFNFAIWGMCGCKMVSLGARHAGTTNQVWQDDFYLNKSDCKDYSKQKCNEILIKGKVMLCDTDIAVPGVSVVLGRGTAGVTDSNGEFTILAHDDTYNPVRVDNLYFVANSCAFTDCNDGCLPPIKVTIQRCVSCNGARGVQVKNTFIKYGTNKGLLSGGSYPTGVVGWDWLDRPTFVQDLGSLYIPTFNETGIAAPSRVRLDIDAAAIFPEETKYLTFWFGAEANTQKFVTWIADNIQFVDNGGLENKVAPTQIKIYYRSLVEYAKQNNFNTTAAWNFIPENSTEPVVSDKVVFQINGDGKFFNKAVTSLVKYDKEGQYFLINYSDDLKDLKSNAIMRLVRPKECTGIEPYYEVCQVVEISNRRAQVQALYLNVYDTYYINRQIPVPILQPKDKAEDPDTFINEVRVLGVPFEHNSPSDFWGDGCWSGGRIHTKNPYETVLYRRAQFALSGVLAETGVLNYLDYFDSAKKKTFEVNGLNGVTGAYAETNRILVIGQNKTFVAGYNDDLIRANADGTIKASGIKGFFGEPQNVESYGCMLYDKKTLYRKNRVVQWLDGTLADVRGHDFESGYSLSKMWCDGDMRAKVKFVQEYNRTEKDKKRYFHGVITPFNEYLLTDKIIGSPEYVNNLRGRELAAQETLVFGVLSRYFKGDYSFTGESYAELEGEKNDHQLFSFKQGVPYRHYTTSSNKRYLNFYGVPVNRVFEMPVVIDNFKKKRPLSIGVYCKQGTYFADKILTEAGQESRILLDYWLQSDYGFYAPFLCDLATLPDANLKGLDPLLDGNMLTGNWITVRLIGDPATDPVYTELQGITVEVFPLENSGT